MASPTAHSMEWLRRRGFIVTRCETWVPLPGKLGGGIRRDAFGIADIIAVHPRDRLVLLVQATSLSNVSSRVAKIQGKPEAVKLLQAGIRIEIWGWGKRAGRWVPKIVSIRPDDLEPVIVQRIPRRPTPTVQPELFT
jgi:hypothetical protein